MKAIRFAKKDGSVSEESRLVRDIMSLIRLSRDGDYEVVVRPVKAIRSPSQNRLLWMWMGCLEDEFGTDRHVWKNHLCLKFIPKVVTVNGKEELYPGETKNLSKEDFSLLLDKVQAYILDEFGVSLPTPDDLAWEYFSQRYKYTEE